VQYFAEARVVGKVSASVFLPKPKVESALLAVTRRETVAVDPAVISESALFDVIRTAFQHRRKMLRRSLAAWATAETFERAGVDPTCRPEELTLEQFARLAVER
jgi:16S rRNA (adenine1518-N6/adenine1519-N6)-dimethyltransferase